MIWKWEEILLLGFARSNFPEKNKRLLAVWLQVAYNSFDDNNHAHQFQSSSYPGRDC